MITNGGPKYWIQSSATHFASLSSLVHNRNTQLVQRAPTHHVAENNFGTVWSPRQRCWKSGFWRMTFGCTCWTLELSSHIVKNLRSGTTETKSPEFFLLTWVPTVVMDILTYFLLVRRQWFLNNCFTVTTIFIVKGVSSVIISSAPLQSGSGSYCSVSEGKEQVAFKTFRSDRD